MMSKPLTGRTVFLITASAFGVIIAVNVTMAYNAVSSFPGLEVDNSYVASQQFDARRSAQEGLGWQVTPTYTDGQLGLQFTDAAGLPVSPENLSVLVGRTTAAQDDVRPEFVGGYGAFEAPVDLQRGKWMLQVHAQAPDGTVFQQRLSLRVTE